MLLQRDEALPVIRHQQKSLYELVTDVLYILYLRPIFLDPGLRRFPALDSHRSSRGKIDPWTERG